MTDSTKATKRRKRVPNKLYQHASGRWAKKVAGKTRYFGKVADDPNGDKALQLWLAQKDDLLNGREPELTQRPNTLTVADTCNLFLGFKQRLVDSGELAERSFARYLGTCRFLVDQFGRGKPVTNLRPSDFESLRAKMAKRWQAVALGVEIQMVRSVFKYAYDAELIDRPVRFGPGFKKPSAKTLRKTRTTNGPRMFEPPQIHALLKHSTTNMRAMILLGLNCGLGNSDLAMLTKDIASSEWLNYPREKTAVDRRIPLWPETCEAIRAVIAEGNKPTNPDDAVLLFIGRRGQNYIGNHRGYRVTAEYNRVATLAGVEGRSFYDLRRTFETVAGDTGDQVCVNAVMGHAPPANDMAAIYRQRIGDERLQRVVNHVRGWLYNECPATC